MYGFEPMEVNLKNTDEKQEVENFLKEFGLLLDKDVDYTLVIRENGIIKATCSKAKNVFKCFAVSLDLRGEGVTSTLISNLTDKLFEEGIYHSFIFTKPETVDIFSSLNFKVVHRAKDVVLLESGFYDINDNLDKMVKRYDIGKGEKGAIVMNCNPFTLGHRYLIEEASRQSKEVLIFIVEEDKSLFPFRVRYELVSKGVSDLKNVKVIPGGEYIISSATFPSYFLREESTKLKAYTELDAGIFGKYFCSKLNIVKRFVGTEPYCKVTKLYNDSLKETLKQYGVEVIELERKEEKGLAISASEVRNLIKCGKIESIRNLVPNITFEFLNTKDGREIVERIKGSNSPH